MFARFSSFIFFSMMVVLLSAMTQSQAKTLRVAIGHQSMCTDTYTAGIVVKELKITRKISAQRWKVCGY